MMVSIHNQRIPANFSTSYKSIIILPMLHKLYEQIMLWNKTIYTHNIKTPICIQYTAFYMPPELTHTLIIVFEFKNKKYSITAFLKQT